MNHALAMDPATHPLLKELASFVLLAAIALSLSPARAQEAASAAAPPSVADATSPVPAVQYRSVFADTPTGVEQESVDWKKANAEVGQFRRGHVDILKWEAQQPAAPGDATKSVAPHDHGTRTKP